LVIWGNDIAAALAAGNVLESARWEVHPDWCYQLGCQSTDDDIAFVQLEAPAPALPIPPVVLETRWSASTRIGQTLELVGFGGDELGPGGESGIKRTAAAPVQQVYRTEKLLIGEDGASSTFGDSGGPALLRLSDGSYEVVGLASYAIGAANSEGWYISVFPSLCWVREASGVELPSMPDDWTCEEPIDNAAESCSVSNTRNAPPSLLLLTPCLLRRRRQQSR
jgi:hypothetical protein